MRGVLGIVTASVMLGVVAVSGREAHARGTTQVPSLGPSPSGASREQALDAAIELIPGATCLDEDRLEPQVAAWLGRATVHGDVHVLVRGDDHDPGAVTFRITAGGKARDRRFDRLPDDCAEATAVVGLAIALAIDAGALGNLVSGGPDPSPARRLVAVQVTGGFDVLAGASAGVTAGVELGLADWLGLRLDLLAQGSWGNPIDGTAGVFDAYVAAGEPKLCAGGTVTDALRLELCSGAGLGAVHAQGRGFAASRAATGPFVIGTAGVRVLFGTKAPWAVDLDAVFPLHVPSFRAESRDGQALDRAPDPAGLMLSVGPAFTF